MQIARVAEAVKCGPDHLIDPCPRRLAIVLPDGDCSKYGLTQPSTLPGIIIKYFSVRVSDGCCPGHGCGCKVGLVSSRGIGIMYGSLPNRWHQFMLERAGQVQPFKGLQNRLNRLKPHTHTSF